ncbi:MAG: tetratricopeptide repeat protein, partial [Luteibaculum sp.]
AALASIEKIEKKDFRLRSAYQYLAFNRGVELFLAKNYREALAQFQKVGQYQMEKKLITSALFWQGECYYQMANYDLAAGAYSRFTSRGDAYGTGYYHKAQYNLGYCYFKQQDFESAKKSFRDFVTGRSNVEPELMSDGLTRTADCYFVQKDYLTAADFYQRATKLKQAEEDYAQFQLAICQGFLDKSGDKIASLENYEKRYPESPYIQDALYELGDAYFKKGENQQALASFNRLVEEYPNGVWTKKALLTSGLIFYRNKQVDEALATFKRIAEQYPDYKEAKEAIQRAEDIYVELGRIEEYNNWVEGLSFANVSTAGLDSVNYRAAENFFTKGDCEAAIDAFERYLKKFEPAIFAVNAHFYMAECYFRAESYDLAQKNYQFIADQPDNKFTEPALITVAYLNYLDSNYSMALDQYRRLEQLATFKTNRIEAKIGQMRCYKQLDKARETMDYANKVLFYSGIPDDKRVEALLTKADAERRLGRIEDAYTTYDSLASFTRSEEGAEARFKMAEIKYEQGNYVDAQEIIYESTNIKPVYDKWLAKSFILLSDVLLKMDDYFQAKATLQSIIDFHEGDDIVELAKSKLQNILELEAKENEGESKDLEINVGGKDQKEYEKLFESEKVDPDKQGPAADSTIQKTAKQP